MTTYRVRFSIDGYIDIEADSREEAEDMTRATSRSEWAAAGDLIVDEPLTLAEYAAAIQETREGPQRGSGVEGGSALDASGG